MNSSIFTIDINPTRMVLVGLFLLSPIIISMFIALKTKRKINTVKYVSVSTLSVYLAWVAIFVFISLLPSLLWYLEGHISDNLFMFLTHPKGIFQSILDYLILLIQILVLAYIPVKLKPRLLTCSN